LGNEMKKGDRGLRVIKNPSDFLIIF